MNAIEDYFAALPPALAKYLLEAIANGREISESELTQAPIDCSASVRARALIQWRAAKAYLEYCASIRGGPESRPRLLPGTRLGEYVIDREIGEGGMGVVYLARQQSLGERAVALKVLKAGLAGTDAKSRSRMKREALLAAQLHHPNLAEIYGFGEQDGIVYLAMRFVTGPRLHDIIAHLSARRRSGIALNRDHVAHGVSLVHRVAEAAATMHASGIVHRDIKPSNVIVESDASDLVLALTGNPVLIDLGLAKMDGTHAITTRTLIGTVEYDAPEVRLGAAPDARSDVFQLGVMLHDLVTARIPGSDRSPAASEPLPDPRTLNPAIDADLAGIIMLATEIRPARRYQDAAALCDDLQRYSEHSPVRARPASLIQRARLWARRNPSRAFARGLAAALAVLVLWAAGVIGTVYWDASVAARHEAEGNLVDARLCYLSLIDAPWKRLLPGIEKARARARLYGEHDPNAGTNHGRRIHLGDVARGLDSNDPEDFGAALRRIAEALVMGAASGDDIQPLRAAIVRGLADPRDECLLETVKTAALTVRSLAAWPDADSKTQELRAILMDHVQSARPVPREIRQHAVSALGFVSVGRDVSATENASIVRMLLGLYADADPELIRLAWVATVGLFASPATCPSDDLRVEAMDSACRSWMSRPDLRMQDDAALALAHLLVAAVIGAGRWCNPSALEAKTWTGAFQSWPAATASLRERITCMGGDLLAFKIDTDFEGFRTAVVPVFDEPAAHLSRRHVIDSPSSGAAEAVFDFESETPALDGLARSCSFLARHTVEHGGWFLEFSPWLEGEAVFEVEAPPNATGWMLEIDHLKGAVAHLPNRGEARVRVVAGPHRLELVAPTVSTRHASIAMGGVAQCIRPGSNLSARTFEIALSTLPSTAAYRLVRVRVTFE